MTEILTEDDVRDAYQNHYSKKDGYQDSIRLFITQTFFPKGFKKNWDKEINDDNYENAVD